MSELKEPHEGHSGHEHGAWLFADAIPSTGAAHWLSRDEARHATGSRRMRAGDAVTLFDGCGAVAHATLGDARRDDGALEVRIASVHREPLQGRHVTMASAVPKGDRLATLMEGIGPLGVAEFVPIRAERSVVPWSDHLAQRCRRILIECAKQSHSPWITRLPRPGAPIGDVAGLAREAASAGARVLIADREGEPVRDVARAIDPSHRVFVLIGPEGGLSERERSAAVTSGATRVSLGPAILRVELAATVAAAILRQG